jgi:glucokinase
MCAPCLEAGVGVTVRDCESPAREPNRSLEDILASYLKDSPGAAPRAGCFGVAGTVIDGKCRATKLPWQLDEQARARAVGAPRVKLLNELEATGYGILHLPADELCALNPGREEEGALMGELDDVLDTVMANWRNMP